MALSAKNEMFMKDKRKPNGCTSVTNMFHRQLVGTMLVGGGDVVSIHHKSTCQRL